MDEPKPLLDHIEDLRTMLIRCAIALGVSMALSFAYLKTILGICYGPLVVIGQDPTRFLKSLHPTDTFMLAVQVSFFAGLLFALPFLFYFIAEFVLPALTLSERRLIFPVFAASSLLFAGGVLFCYFVILPPALQFFIDFSLDNGISPEWTASGYVSFVVQLLAAFGVSFQMPIVILSLAKLGLVDYALLSSHRAHAAVGICILAAVITPTPDALTMCLMAGPMYLLFEICVFLSWFIMRREQALEASGGELSPNAASPMMVLVAILIAGFAVVGGTVFVFGKYAPAAGPFTGVRTNAIRSAVLETN